MSLKNGNDKCESSDSLSCGYSESSERAAFDSLDDGAGRADCAMSSRSESEDEEFERIASAVKQACEMSKEVLLSGRVQNVEEDVEKRTPGLKFLFKEGDVSSEAGTSFSCSDGGKRQLESVAAVVDGQVIQLQYTTETVDASNSIIKTHFILDSLERTPNGDLRAKYTQNEETISAKSSGDEGKDAFSFDRMQKRLKECMEGCGGKYIPVKNETLISMQKMMLDAVNHMFEERLRSVEQEVEDQAQLLRRCDAGRWQSTSSARASQDFRQNTEELSASEVADTVD